jgi:hypothetical protein
MGAFFGSSWIFTFPMLVSMSTTGFFAGRSAAAAAMIPLNRKINSVQTERILFNIGGASLNEKVY